MVTYGINTAVASGGTDVFHSVSHGIAEILAFVGCRNVQLAEPPILTTQEQWADFMRVWQGQAQPKNEAWFTERIRTGTRSDFNRASGVAYHQIDEVVITGLAWHRNFRESYVYVQDKSEEVLYCLEKNKGLLQASQTELFTTLRCVFSWRRFGEVFLYRSDTRMEVLSTIIEGSRNTF